MKPNLRSLSWRRLLFACVTAALLVAGAGCATTYSDPPELDNAYADETINVEVNVFYNDLAPYGRWVNVAPYGWCWTPYDFVADWRPYYDGYWAYTDYGWCWISNEPYGWATYHYGRWAFDSSFGWIWVPGSVWAPAWVSWQCGGDWMGWAPLPPGAIWHGSSGLLFDGPHTIPSSHWCFVQNRHLSTTKMKTHVASIGRNVTLLKQTRDYTRYKSKSGTPINEGLDVREYERTSGVKVKAVQVESNPVGPSGRGDAIKGDTVRLYRPEVKESEVKAGPPPDAIRDTKVKAAPDPTLEKERAKSRAELERSIEKQRKTLEKEHSQIKTRPTPPGVSDEERRQAIDEEKAALEKRAEEQRKALEKRQEQQIEKAAKPKRPATPTSQTDEAKKKPEGAKAKEPAKNPPKEKESRPDSKPADPKKKG